MAEENNGPGAPTAEAPKATVEAAIPTPRTGEDGERAAAHATADKLNSSLTDAQVDADFSDIVSNFANETGEDPKMASESTDKQGFNAQNEQAIADARDQLSKGEITFDQYNKTVDAALDAHNDAANQSQEQQTDASVAAPEQQSQQAPAPEAPSAEAKAAIEARRQELEAKFTNNTATGPETQELVALNNARRRETMAAQEQQANQSANAEAQQAQPVAETTTAEPPQAEQNDNKAVDAAAQEPQAKGQYREKVRNLARRVTKPVRTLARKFTGKVDGTLSKLDKNNAFAGEINNLRNATAAPEQTGKHVAESSPTSNKDQLEAMAALGYEKPQDTLDAMDAARKPKHRAENTDGSAAQGEQPGAETADSQNESGAEAPTLQQRRDALEQKMKEINPNFDSSNPDVQAAFATAMESEANMAAMETMAEQFGGKQAAETAKTLGMDTKEFANKSIEGIVTNIQKELAEIQKILDKGGTLTADQQKMRDKNNWFLRLLKGLGVFFKEMAYASKDAALAGAKTVAGVEEKKK